MRRSFLKVAGLPAAGVILSLAVAAGLSMPPARAAAAPARARIVQISNFALVPAVLTVTPGTTVTWNNADEDPHTVTASAKAFRSPALDTGDKYSFTFAVPGDFAYFCSLHPHMVGSIVVKAD